MQNTTNTHPNQAGINPNQTDFTTDMQVPDASASRVLFWQREFSSGENSDGEIFPGSVVQDSVVSVTPCQADALFHAEVAVMAASDAVDAVMAASDAVDAARTALTAALAGPDTAWADHAARSYAEARRLHLAAQEQLREMQDEGRLEGAAAEVRAALDAWYDPYLLPHAYPMLLLLLPPPTFPHGESRSQIQHD